MNIENKYRKNYEKRKEAGIDYDSTMEYYKESDVESGSWIMVIRQVPVASKPQLYGIYWGVPKQDTYDRQVCLIHTTEDITLLNHEYTTISEEKLKMYREEGWEVHEVGKVEHSLNMKLIEEGRALCEEERETIWALQLDGLSEEQACEEYFLSKHTDYNNYTICYLPKKEVYEQCVAMFGER